jgi:hypothetical protein
MKNRSRTPDYECMSRSEYIDRLVSLTLEISALLDRLPHATPLADDERVRVQGRMLALKTSLDHAAAETDDISPEGLAIATVARQVLARIDHLAWDSDPDRKWYAALYEARGDVEKFVKAARR